MTSKEQIFSSLRSADVAPVQMPELDALEACAITYDDKVAAFASALEKAGGVLVEKAAESLVEKSSVSAGSESEGEIGCVPEDDSFTVTGSFGVAENACVWIDDSSFEDRRDLFIHERLIIRLKRDAIVNNMHEAYRCLGESALTYGVFISGPSKTADIEQALVFGAHGPRSLVVVLE